MMRAWLLLPFFRLASAALTNRTIDDQQGDAVTGLMPFYSGSWKYGPECSDCFVQPDASKAFRNSWHDTTIDAPAQSSSFPSVTLTFTGTAIYVFTIIPNTVVVQGLSATTFTNLTFTLDGTLLSETFTHSPDTSTIYEYNVPVYTTQELDNVQHTLKVEAQAGTQSSYLAFDYAIYTFDDSVTTTSSSSPSNTATSGTSNVPHSTSPTIPATSSPNSKNSIPVAAIVGGVVGGVATVTALFLVLFCLRRRRRQGADAIQRVHRNRNSDIDVIGGGKIEDVLQRDALASEHLLAGGPAFNRRLPSSPDTVVSAGYTSRSGDARLPFIDRAANVSSTSLGTSFPGSQYGYGVSAGDEHPPQRLGATATSPTDIHGHHAREDSVASIPAAVLPLANTSRARSQKAAQRHQELARQVRELEQTVASLNAQRTAEIPASPVHASAEPDRSAEEALRRQVEALQLEVERLKEEQEEQRLLAMEPPPAYEHAPEAASEGDQSIAESVWENIRALSIPT